MTDFLGWIRENPGKFIALCISSVYLLCAYILGGPVGFVQTLMILIFALACIFYGDVWGSYIGPSYCGSGWITEKTPGWMIIFIGWTLLLMPVTAAVWGIAAFFMNTKKI